MNILDFFEMFSETVNMEILGYLSNDLSTIVVYVSNIQYEDEKEYGRGLTADEAIINLCENISGKVITIESMRIRIPKLTYKEEQEHVSKTICFQV